MSTISRRYDIDWLRVIAIGLLLIYHVAIGFQSWGIMIGFITNDQPWGSLWIPMGMLNVWRIPFLFFVSGMGVYFAMQQRKWSQLIQERALRIFLPYVFGAIAIFPISSLIWQKYYNWDINYSINPGHLWFLGNIFIYVIILSPLFYYFRKNEGGKIVGAIRKLFSSPLGLLIVMTAFIGEVMVVQPNPYEMYAMTWHGFILGLLAFFFGFCFVISGPGFWSMLLRWRWVFVVVAIGLSVIRVIYLGGRVPGYQLVIESQCWILAVFAFGHKYLNRGGKVLSYLSEAAYPVYILHMITLFTASYFIFPLEIPVASKFSAVLVLTFAGCFLLYEGIKRVNVLRPLFGLKMKSKSYVQAAPGLL